MKEFRGNLTKNSNKQKATAPPTYEEVLKHTEESLLKPSKTTRLIRQVKGDLQKKGLTAGKEHVVIIKPNCIEEDMQDTIEKINLDIQNEIQPAELGLQVTGCYINKSNLCIKVGSEKQTKILKEAIEKLPRLTEKAEIKLPVEKFPKILLINLPCSIENDKLLKHIYKQNDYIHREIEEEEFCN